MLVWQRLNWDHRGQTAYVSVRRSRSHRWLAPSLPPWLAGRSNPPPAIVYRTSHRVQRIHHSWNGNIPKIKHRLLHLATAAFFRVYFWVKWSPEAQVARMDWMFWVGLKLMQVAANLNFSNDTTLHFSNESKPHLIVHLYSQERIQQFYLGKWQLKGQLGQVKRFLGPSLLCKIWDLKQK